MKPEEIAAIVARAQSTQDIGELRMRFNSMAGEFLKVSADLSVANCVINGTWPNAEGIMETARAKVKRPGDQINEEPPEPEKESNDD